MTERDYAIRSFKEITLNAARHTEERMDLYYEKMKALMNNYQDLILENQLVLDELEQECQEKINENMAYALQYMDSYDYRMNLGKLKKEVNNIILISIPPFCGGTNSDERFHFPLHCAIIVSRSYTTKHGRRSCRNLSRFKTAF